MEFALQSDAETLQTYRKMYPVDAKTQGHVKRMPVLRFREALCLHYEVNPFNMPISSIPIQTKASVKLEIEEEPPINIEGIIIQDIRRMWYLLSSLPEHHEYFLNPNLLYEKLGLPKNFLDFHTFVKTADLDSYRIEDCFQRSVVAGEIEYVDPNHIDALVDKKRYVAWAASKGLPLPTFMTEDVELWIPPPLGKFEDVKQMAWDNFSLPVLLSLIANGIAQLYKRIDPSTLVSEICQSPPMSHCLKLMSRAEKKDVKKPDTVRGLIEHQFQSRN